MNCNAVIINETYCINLPMKFSVFLVVKFLMYDLTVL